MLTSLLICVTMGTSTDSEHTMAFSYCDDTYSDLYKDVYGFRPRGAYESWLHMSDEEKQAEWEYLCGRLDEVIKEQKEYEAAAVVEFEKLVTKTIEAGAGDRLTALRWIMDASDCNGDWEFLCWHHRLPYGYFKVVPSARLPYDQFVRPAARP